MSAEPAEITELAKNAAEADWTRILGTPEDDADGDDQ
jgi:hypothetical protein